MDELPTEAQRILALARGAQPAPEARARQRVHEHIHAVLSTTVLLRGEQAPHAGGQLGGGQGFFNSTKILLASAALMIGTGAALLSMRAPPALVSNPPPTAPSQDSTPAPLEPVGEQAIAPPAPARTVESPEASPSRLAARRAPESQLALAAELSLLSQASDALSNGDTAKAQDALAQHRRRFRNPQLREEREGLMVLVDCVGRQHAAQSKAIAFVERHPASLLAARIKRACTLADGS